MSSFSFKSNTLWYPFSNGFRPGFSKRAGYKWVSFRSNQTLSDEKRCRLSGVFQVIPTFPRILNFIFRCRIREFTFFSQKNTTSWFRFTKDFCTSKQISQYFCMFVVVSRAKSCFLCFFKKSVRKRKPFDRITGKREICIFLHFLWTRTAPKI